MRIMTICALFVVLALTVPAGAVPPMPQEFYGTVTIGGAAAPAGSVIVAFIDGEERGSVTTSAAGSYGGTETFDERLVVTAGDDESGATITFEVNGNPAIETAVVDPGAITQLDLSVAGGISGGGGGSTGPSDASEDEEPVETGAAPETTVSDETGTFLPTPSSPSPGEESPSQEPGGEPATTGAEAAPGLLPFAVLVIGAFLLVIRKRGM